MDPMQEVSKESEVNPKAKKQKKPYKRAKIEYYDGSFIHVGRTEVDRIILILNYMNNMVKEKGNVAVSARKMEHDLKVHHQTLIYTLRCLFGAKSISIVNGNKKITCNTLIKVEQGIFNPKSNLPGIPASYKPALKIRIAELGSG